MVLSNVAQLCQTLSVGLQATLRMFSSIPACHEGPHHIPHLSLEAAVLQAITRAQVSCQVTFAREPCKPIWGYASPGNRIILPAHPTESLVTMFVISYLKTRHCTLLQCCALSTRHS